MSVRREAEETCKYLVVHLVLEALLEPADLPLERLDVFGEERDGGRVLDWLLRLGPRETSRPARDVAPLGQSIWA